MEVNFIRMQILDIQLSENNFENNIGGFEFTSNVYFSCFLSPFSSDNNEFGKYRYSFDGLEIDVSGIFTEFKKDLYRNRIESKYN